MKNIAFLKKLKKNPQNFVRVKIGRLNNYTATINTTPPFSFRVEDYSLSKRSEAFGSEDSQTVFNPSIGVCPRGQYMTGYQNDDGTPACARPGYAASRCRRNEVVVGVKQDGTVECGIAPVANSANGVRLRGGACPPGQVARQLASTGQLVCVIAVQINLQCPSGTFVYGIDAKGKIICRTI